MCAYGSNVALAENVIVLVDILRLDRQTRGIIPAIVGSIRHPIEPMGRSPDPVIEVLSGHLKLPIDPNLDDVLAPGSPMSHDFDRIPPVRIDQNRIVSR